MQRQTQMPTEIRRICPHDGNRRLTACLGLWAFAGYFVVEEGKEKTDVEANAADGDAGDLFRNEQGVRSRGPVAAQEAETGEHLLPAGFADGDADPSDVKRVADELLDMVEVHDETAVHAPEKDGRELTLDGGQRVRLHHFSVVFQVNDGVVPFGSDLEDVVVEAAAVSLLVADENTVGQAGLRLFLLLFVRSREISFWGRDVFQRHDLQVFGLCFGLK